MHDNDNDTTAQEHTHAWMRDLTRALMNSDLPTIEVNSLIQHYAAQLKEES